MADNLPTTDPPPTHPATRHERSDVGLHWFKIILVCSLVLAAFIHLTVLWFQKRYEAYQATVKKSGFAYSGQRPALPAGPRLDPLVPVEAITPSGKIISSDDSERPEEKEKILNSYGTYGSLTKKEQFLHTGKEEGAPVLTHIPIDRAMKLLVADQGPKQFRLTARKPPEAKQAKEDQGKARGLIFGGGPSSGRLFQGDGR